MGKSVRLVLASGFANGGLGEAVNSFGWEQLYSVPPGHAASTEHVWRIDPEHTFHYFECTNYPLQYCSVMGPQHDLMLMLISARLDFLDADDLLAAFDRAATVEEREVTTFALGVGGGGEPDEDTAVRLRAALGDAEARVRLAGVEAAFATGWEIFRGELERLSVSDPDAAVRQAAAGALSGPPPADAVGPGGP